MDQLNYEKFTCVDYLERFTDKEFSSWKFSRKNYEKDMFEEKTKAMVRKIHKLVEGEVRVEYNFNPSKKFQILFKTFSSVSLMNSGLYPIDLLIRFGFLEPLNSKACR